jgi:hypothetical protein
MTERLCWRFDTPGLSGLFEKTMELRREKNPIFRADDPDLCILDILVFRYDSAAPDIDAVSDSLNPALDCYPEEWRGPLGPLYVCELPWEKLKGEIVENAAEPLPLPCGITLCTSAPQLVVDLLGRMHSGDNIFFVGLAGADTVVMPTNRPDPPWWLYIDPDIMAMSRGELACDPEVYYPPEAMPDIRQDPPGPDTPPEP